MRSEIGFAVLLTLLIFSLGFVFFLLLKERVKKTPDTYEKLFLDLLESLRKEIKDASDSSRKEALEASEKIRLELQEKLEKITQKLSESANENLRTIQSQFKQSSELISKVSEKLTKLDETNKQVLGFSEKLESLENILRNPKKRGVLGEYFLETLLSNFFVPNQFQMQYKFKDGKVVDAVIFFNNQIIPIDSKFSLEKYNEAQEEKDLEKRERLWKEFLEDARKRIDETADYIRPNENTVDFAFMFIPAEGIYYALISSKGQGKNLIEYAFSKRVIVTSPSSFFAYLQTVIQGLKMLKFQEDVRQILKNVTDLERHLKSFAEYFRKIGNNLSSTVNSFNLASKEFSKIDKDVFKLSDGNSERFAEEVLQLEKPSQEE